jgi:peptide-methionine (S)-S-oxide reductase
MAAKEVATLGGGCFWCTEAVFGQLRGVERVESGFSGGQTRNPKYRDVCTGGTGHAEVINLTFNPSVISYEELLRIFFTVHDPTTLNRQGHDEGTQYRSVILYHDIAQKETAERVIKDVNDSGLWGRPVVTQVVPFEAFYRAEDYHQDYFRKNPSASYCQLVIAPKVAKFRKNYIERLKSSPGIRQASAPA